MKQTETIPGFGEFKVEDYTALLDQGRNRDYSIKKIMDYDQVRAKISDAMMTDPTLTNITDESRKLLASRKKTEDDYDVFYDKYFRAIRDIIQREGYGVYVPGPNGCSISIPLDELAKDITSSFVGFDCLEDARNDPSITDIYCLSYDQIIVEKSGHNVPYWKHFRSDQDYRNFIDRILQEDNKAIDQGERKIVDAEIFGIRFNVIHPMVSSKGMTVTLRKHADQPITLEQMIENGTMTEQMAEFCKLTIRGALNACVVGVTGSGKTTLLKALFEGALGNGDPDYYVDEEMNRVITVEDTPELFLRVPHTVALHTVPTGDPKTEITLRSLNLSALRMKPHYIVVGEIRGVEAASYVEAAATGHSSWASIHAGTAQSAINRFVDKYGMTMPNLSSEAVERIIGSSVNFLILIDNIPGIGRRITAIHELIFNHRANQVEIRDIVRFKAGQHRFVWYNVPSEESVDMMLRRGVKQETIDQMFGYIQNEIDTYAKERQEGGAYA